MDEEALISRLCLEAGAIMEDTAAVAIRRLPEDQAGQREVIDILRLAAADILALGDAAAVIARRQRD